MKKLLLIICLYASQAILAQQRIGPFVSYGTETGLAQNVYHNVFESSDGYWWISSNNGISRFDGKRFKQFNALYNNKNSPTDNNITDIVEDNAGNIWMAGFEHGVARYHLKSGAFRQYPVLSTDSNSSYYGVFSIFKDSGGSIWFGTAGRGLAVYVAQTDSFTFFYPDSAGAKDGTRYGQNFVSGVVEDKDNKDMLWVSGLNGLYCFNKKQQRFTGHFTTKFFDPGGTPLNGFLCIEQMGNDLLLGTWFGGLMLFNKFSGTFSRIPFKKKNEQNLYNYCVLNIKTLGDSVAYLACINDGLLAYHPQNRQLSVSLGPGDAAFINKQINIQRVSLTPNAGLFAGGNSAIYQLHPRGAMYSKPVAYTYKSLYPGVKGMLMSGMTYDSAAGGYWFAYENAPGLVFRNDNFSKQEDYALPAGGDTWFTDVAVDKTGQLWAMGTDGRIYWADRVHKKLNIAVIPGMQEKGVNNGYEDLAAGADGAIWAAGGLSACRYNPVNREAISFNLQDLQNKMHLKTLFRNLVLVTDMGSNAWLNSIHGLIRLNSVSRQVEFFTDSLKPAQKPASTAVKCMVFDHNNRLWLGYFNAGIQVLDINTRQISKSFTSENGLPAMEINFIACDRANNIAACVHNGLAVYNAASDSWQLLNRKDGLAIDFLDVPIFTGKGTEIVLDQRGSFVRLQLGQLWNNSDSTVTHITTLKVNAQPVSAALLPDFYDYLELPPATSDVSIEFSATNWQFPFRTRYFYRVDGVHPKNEWLDNTEGVVNLTGLSSGTYVFHFYAILASGKKTAQRSFTIRILPPFYKTWWFILLCMGSFASVLYALYRYRVNQLNRMFQVRNSISANLHDDIGATLSNINILNELARRNISSPDKANNYLRRASDDIQQVSENLSDIVWNISPLYDDISNLLMRMKRYAADMLEGRNIDCEINIHDNVNAVKLTMERRRNFFLIFKEAVNNLSKYSGAGRASIEVKVEDARLIMTICDNGRGFNPAEIQYGNGLKNMQQRAVLSRGSLLVESAVNQGTKITLLMPV